MPERQEIIDELIRRKTSLPPEKRAIVEELERRQAASTPKPKAEQPRPGFVERAYDATLGGVIETGKSIWQKGAPRVVDEMGTAMGKRFQENPQGTTNIYARAADAVIGPTVDLVADDIQAGNYLGAAGTVAGNVAMMGLPAILRNRPKGAPPAPSAYNRTAPPARTANAVQTAKEVGWPTTVGEEIGSPLLQKVERMGENVMGASDVATAKYSSRNEQILGTIRSKAPTATKSGKPVGGLDKTGAAQAVIDVVEGTAKGFQQSADSLYDSVRSKIASRQAEADAAHARLVQRIEKDNRLAIEYAQNRKQLAHEAGVSEKPWETVDLKPIPEPKQVGQINLAPIKKQLQPMYDELSKTLPETQRAASPGYQALKNIVENEAATAGVLELERDLGMLKGILRKEAKKGVAPTQSGRYAAASIDALESKVLKEVRKLGGEDAVKELLDARKATREMHLTYEALREVLPPNGSPAELFASLTREGDKNINKLLNLKKRSGEALDEVAVTVMEGALSKFSGEAGTATFRSVRGEWNKLGPRTKAELFGAEKAKSIDKLMEAADSFIVNVNPSGSASSLMAGRVLTSGALLMGAFTGGVPGVLGGAATAGAGAASANVIAKFLLDGKNAQTLRNAMRFARDPGASKFFMRALDKAVEADPEVLAVLQQARNASTNETAIQPPAAEAPRPQ